MRLQLGTPVRCIDGPGGELCDLVINAATRRVTHLVVEPHHHHALARLVPIELADSDLSLRCTIEELHGMVSVTESDYLGVALPGDGYTDLGTNPGWDDPHVLVTYDAVPQGEIEVRRRSPVTSADGHYLGHVDALVVDADGRVEELVFDRGHGWSGRRVTIPIDGVERLEADSVTLKLTKAAVRHL
jgi:sporulation protein YlmC with PRC-barrel domain